MTYKERLAEFVKVTGSKPGEMNKQIPCFPATQAEVDLFLPRFPGASPKYGEAVSLEPARQSAGPGRCNRFTRVGALGDPSPCKLPSNHEGPHEP